VSWARCLTLWLQLGGTATLLPVDMTAAVIAWCSYEDTWAAHIWLYLDLWKYCIIMEVYTWEFRTLLRNIHFPPFSLAYRDNYNAQYRYKPFRGKARCLPAVGYHMLAQNNVASDAT
jgi:hypothetical protein